MVNRLSLAFLALASLGAISVPAQATENITFEELEACSLTIKPLNQQSTYYFRTDDNTPYSASWTYDPALCSSRYVFDVSGLSNYDYGQSWPCTIPQFDGTGTLATSCRRGTRAAMARIVEESPETPDFELRLVYGPQGLSRTLRQNFGVVSGDEPPAPVPSGSLQKRRQDDQHVFDCPIGHTWCWTGQGQDFACMDTSSDVSACGQCPFAFGAEQSDCTSIEGVDDVECRNSKCVVQACQRGFQISLDRTKCVDGRKRSQARRGLIF